MKLLVVGGIALALIGLGVVQFQRSGDQTKITVDETKLKNLSSTLIDKGQELVGGAKTPPTIGQQVDRAVDRAVDGTWERARAQAPQIQSQFETEVRNQVQRYQSAPPVRYEYRH